VSLDGYDLELLDVIKNYQQGRRVVEAVRGVTLRIAYGEFVSIMGPSGSGKSTLMHLLGGLDKPTRGRVLFCGKDVQAMSDRELSGLRRSRIGFIFQFFNLLPTLTAEENVALPLLLAGWRRSKALVPAAKNSTVSASKTARSIFPISFPAAKCSAWPSPVPWWSSRKRVV